MDGPNGNNLFALAIRRLLNSSLLAQRDKHLGCERYERIPTRNVQRKGFKPRTIRTSTGKITLDVPQVRNTQTPFTPIIPGFERGSRIDRALNLAIRREPSIRQADDSKCLIYFLG